MLLGSSFFHFVTFVHFQSSCTAMLMYPLTFNFASVMCKSVQKLESERKSWPQGQPSKVWCWWVGLIPDAGLLVIRQEKWQHSNEGTLTIHRAKAQ